MNICAGPTQCVRQEQFKCWLLSFSSFFWFWCETHYTNARSSAQKEVFISDTVISAPLGHSDASNKSTPTALLARGRSSKNVLWNHERELSCLMANGCQHSLDRANIKSFVTLCNFCIMKSRRGGWTNVFFSRYIIRLAKIISLGFVLYAMINAFNYSRSDHSLKRGINYECLYTQL